ncbi:hypothetical protein BC628DRAFT_801585 [Trametes gibbosa]|nr:hypothetical protein BC628DRAFT_801585 [Trametes gibbosa]
MRTISGIFQDSRPVIIKTDTRRCGMPLVRAGVVNPTLNQRSARPSMRSTDHKHSATGLCMSETRLTSRRSFSTYKLILRFSALPRPPLQQRTLDLRPSMESESARPRSVFSFSSQSPSAMIPCRAPAHVLYRAQQQPVSTRPRRIATHA